MSPTEYREKVDRLIRSRTGEPILNGSIDHAAILVERMFAHANIRMWILSEGLNARVYGRNTNIEQAKLFLSNPQHEVRVLIETSSEELRDNPFTKAFGRYENVHIRRVPSEYQADYEYHFALVDDYGYRFEGDKHRREAVAAFGDEAGVQHLAQIYTGLWDASEPVNLSSVEQVRATA
jgi:hypothetical protein